MQEADPTAVEPEDDGQKNENPSPPVETDLPRPEDQPPQPAEPARSDDRDD
jgi:hypothetical protein